MSLVRSRLVEFPDGTFGASVRVSADRLQWFMTLFAAPGEAAKKGCKCQDKVPVESIDAEKATCKDNLQVQETEKPAPQIVSVAGADSSIMGMQGDGNDLRLQVAELVADPRFQQFAMERRGLSLEEVDDAVLMAAAFVQEVAGRPLELLDAESVAAVVRLFEVSQQ